MEVRIGWESVCVCFEYEKRLKDEEESGAQQTDWGVNERYYYSSQQGEGEITTHSVLLLPVSVCTHIYNMGLKSCLPPACVTVTLQAEKSKHVEGENKRWVDSVLISITTATMSNTHVAHAHTQPALLDDVEIMEFCSWWIWVVNEKLISSSEPLGLRKEGVLDPINLLPYWIGSLPGSHSRHHAPGLPADCYKLPWNNSNNSSRCQTSTLIKRRTL